MQPFLFLRHGQSTANRDRVIAGSTDAALTELGEAQAREAAIALAGSGIRRIVASPQRRALRTAEIVAGALGLLVATDPGLVERHWGEWEGRLVADRPDYFMVPEGGESWEAFRDRAWAACRPILAAGPAPLAGPAALLIVAMPASCGCCATGWDWASRPGASATPCRCDSRRRGLQAYPGKSNRS
jgi:probable phosphoglycerate mutase